MTLKILTVWLGNFLAKESWGKSCSYNVGEIDFMLNIVKA